MAVNEEVLLDIRVQDQDALNNIAKLTQANADLKAQLAAVKKEYTDGNVSQSDYAKQSAVINAQIKENTSGIRENSKEIKTNAASVASAEGSINSMRARVADLTAGWNSLSKTAREGDAGKQIQAEMFSLNTSINAANKSVGNFKDNIGNYPQAMEGMMLSNTKVGKTMESLGITAGTSMKQMGESVSSGVKAVSSSFKALLLNPVVAFFAAIMVSGMALYSVFKDFKPVVDRLEQAMAALGAVFSVIKNSIIGLITGQKSLKESTSGLGGAMADAASQAAKLKKAQQELEDAAFGVEEANKREETQIQKLMLQSRNRTLSEADRAKKLDEVQRLNESIYQRNKKQNDEEVSQAVKNIAIKANLSKAEQARLLREGSDYARQIQDKVSLSDKDVETLHAALMKKSDIEQQYIGIGEKAQNRIDQNAEKAAANAEKAAEKAKAAAEKRQAAIEKQQDKEIKQAEDLLTLKKQNQKDLDATMLIDPKYLDQRLKMLSQNAEDEKKIIDLKLKYHKFSEEEAKIATQNADKEVVAGKLALQKQQADQLIKELDYELQLNRANNTELLAGKKLTDKQIHDNKLSELQKQYEDELKKLSIKFDSEEDGQDELNKQITLKNAEKNAAIAQENADFDKAEQERRVQARADNYANELSLLNENGDRAIEIKKAQLDAQMAVEIAAAQKNGASVLLVQDKYAKQKKLIDRQASDARLDQEKRISDGVANLFNKTTKAGKIAASASTAIDTYKGAQAAIAGMAGAGPVGWALGAIEAGVIIANGVKTIANINKTSETGESSVSSGSSDATSGSSSGNTTTYTNLPTLSGLYSSNAQQNETAQTIAASTPTPIVKVTEITDMQNTVRVKENSKL